MLQWISKEQEWQGNELLTETLEEEERSLIAKELHYHITEEQIQSSLRAVGDPSSSEEWCWNVDISEYSDTTHW